MSDTFENSSTVPCPACSKENSKSNTFCLECGERIIPLGADGSMSEPVAEANPYAEGVAVAAVAAAPAVAAATAAGNSEAATPPWHEPSENPYTKANLTETNPYSANAPSTGQPYGTGADGAYTAPPSYQRAGNAPRPQSANTIGERAPGEPKTMAIVSLLCCCAFIFGIVGLVTGIIALTKKQNGRGMAIAGIVLSALSLLLGLIVIIAVVMSAQNSFDYLDLYREFGLYGL
jgi:hypothetical protein